MNGNKKEGYSESQASENRKAFNSVSGNDLMLSVYEALQFVIERILPHGLYILAGSPKIGKSWLGLQMAHAVSTGSRFWEFAAMQGEVLYLALEDNYRRLQSRLKTIMSDNTDISRLYFTTASYGITDGLLEQIHSFLTDHCNTKFIIVDTLEHIRNSEYDKNMYAYDYRDMTKLREITDRYGLTLLLVHHTRKMYDPDPVNTISGSTGLVGAVDGVFILEKTKRSSRSAKLTIANRDTEDFCFTLDFDRDKCQWSLVSMDSEIESEEGICILIDDFLTDSWKGTATELSSELKNFSNDSDISPMSITRQIKSNSELFKSKYGISVRFERNRQCRVILLDRIGDAD